MQIVRWTGNFKLHITVKKKNTNLLWICDTQGTVIVNSLRCLWPLLFFRSWCPWQPKCKLFFSEIWIIKFYLLIDLDYKWILYFFLSSLNFRIVVAPSKKLVFKHRFLSDCLWKNYAYLVCKCHFMDIVILVNLESLRAPTILAHLWKVQGQLFGLKQMQFFSC